MKIYDKLGSTYHAKSMVNKLLLQNNLYHLRMDGRDIVTDHLNVSNTLASQINFVDIKMEK